MLSKTRIKWSLGILASIATVIGVIHGFFPKQSPQPLSDTAIQSAGNHSTQIGNVAGDVTINNIVPPSANPPFDGPSDKARAILQQIGRTWSAESFVSAVVDGDIRSVELFLEGGMNPLINVRGASAAVYALQPAANNRADVLRAFVKYGYQPDANLVDTRIMPSFGSIPPHWDEKLTPPGYGAWNKTFVGPADFWIVIRAAYAGPENGDFELLGILKGAGATFKVSMAFLGSYERIYGDTPVYWQVRNEVESLTGLGVTKRQQ
ncbi:MAG: hypothetical protein ACHQ9S_11700 [Candidatus Binatia bacterium]